MKNLLRILWWGMLISFLGSLPLGTMNIAATHISIEKGPMAGFVYALGSMLAEVMVVRFVLPGIGWLTKREKIFRILEFFTTGLLLVLAIGSFIAAYRMTGFANVIPVQYPHPFLTGAILSVTNPLHIPFWLGWSTVLINKEILHPGKIQYNFFVTGIGLGTMLGFTVFIIGGNYFVAQISNHQNILNWLIGIALLATAMLQLKKIIMEPAGVRYGKMARQL
ncbi:MAG: LysE family transporter [Ferruginibacter sp.]